MSSADWFGCSMYMPLARKKNRISAITEITGTRAKMKKGIASSDRNIITRAA
jgi:hypothetical protein